MADNNHHHVIQWRDQLADVAATRREALRKLAPNAQAAATLAAYRASRKRADWRRRIVIALAVIDVLAIAWAACAAI